MEKITLRQIEVLEKIMLRQIKQLAEEYYEYFYLDVSVLIDVIKKVDVAKIVRNLSGVMTGGEIFGVIMKVLEEDISKTSCN